MNGIPHLDNGVGGLHPDNVTWRKFLDGCNLMDTTCLDTDNGWSWYNISNCHYFVRPDGTICHGIFGWHGMVEWNNLLKTLVP